MHPVSILPLLHSALIKRYIVGTIGYNEFDIFKENYSKNTDPLMGAKFKSKVSKNAECHADFNEFEISVK
jgi:hypothetical protein